MQITNFGYFKAHKAPKEHIMLYTQEDGLDWYQIRFALTEWDDYGGFLTSIYGAWALVDQDGLVTAVEHDPSMLSPGDRTVLGIDAPVSEVKIGMTYRDGRLEEPA